MLRLCVSGMTPRSQDAIRCLRTICDEHLPGGYSLEIIDIYQQPELAARHDVVATPTLIKAAPAPFTRLLGSLRDIPRTLARLGILPASSHS
ncbi:MAG: circadian clock KaiB family protein [Vicinamibacterales bacterium]